jgi:hypothetical protein
MMTWLVLGPLCAAGSAVRHVPAANGGLKVPAYFRQRRISLRLSLRNRRGSLLGRCSVNYGLVKVPATAEPVDLYLGTTTPAAHKRLRCACSLSF